MQYALDKGNVVLQSSRGTNPIVALAAKGTSNIVANGKQKPNRSGPLTPYVARAKFDIMYDNNFFLGLNEDEVWSRLQGTNLVKLSAQRAGDPHHQHGIISAAKSAAPHQCSPRRGLARHFFFAIADASSSQ
ncbi:hypothetical protein CDL15_Pgr006731 [Punica granatum]|uniref:Uncharacterized protein n=1 Tax=Punica granatum TaxID=22663 RepID=A0A218X867_PUNGR|nr:hypothetical protein CDL15_Pgr006731 [Punica granatum]PKI48048.1 hypothetical protein CRG98_031565 [Punica granatum]